jgi:hypothetical protein
LALPSGIFVTLEAMVMMMVVVMVMMRLLTRAIPVTVVVMMMVVAARVLLAVGSRGVRRRTRPASSGNYRSTRCGARTGESRRSSCGTVIIDADGIHPALKIGNLVLEVGRR